MQHAEMFVTCRPSQRVLVGILLDLRPHEDASGLNSELSYLLLSV